MLWWSELNPNTNSLPAHCAPGSVALPSSVYPCNFLPTQRSISIVHDYLSISNRAFRPEKYLFDSRLFFSALSFHAQDLMVVCVAKHSRVASGHVNMDQHEACRCNNNLMHATSS